jgi:hypothetical protein
MLALHAVTYIIICLDERRLVARRTVKETYVLHSNVFCRASVAMGQAGEQMN